MIRVVFIVIILSLTTLAQTSTYTREKEWEKEVNALVEIDRRQTPPANAVLFVGSSSIRMWHSLREDFPGVNVINRGFGGSHLEDLVFFAPKIVFPYRPKRIVVYSGENDIEAGQSAENVLADLKAFLLALTDPCVKSRACLAQWIPTPSEDPDGNQLNAVDRDGNRL